MVLTIKARQVVTETAHGVGLQLQELGLMMRKFWIYCPAWYYPAVPYCIVKISMRSAWVAQSVERLTSAQVMILWFMGLSPVSGSVLTAQSLDPALDSVSPSLSAPPLLTLCLSLSLSKHK